MDFSKLKLPLIIIASVVILFYFSKLAGSGTPAYYFPHYAPKYAISDIGNIDQGFGLYNYGVYHN